MPKINGYSRDNRQSSFGVIDLHISWLNQSVTTTSNPTFNNLITTGNVIIGGDLTVQGASTVISSSIVEIKDNIIVINAEETGPGVTLNLAGVEVDRGTSTNFQAVYQAFVSQWSNGQVEGQVNRLKNIKRQMYGRASFDLLRKRVISPLKT